LQRRLDYAKGARLGSNRVGEALGSHPPHDKQRAARHNEAAGKQLIARPLGHVIRLAGQQRFVHLNLPVANQDTIHHNLIAGAHDDNIAAHQFFRADGALLAFANHRDFGPRQQSDAIQLALGAHFLDQANNDVHQDQADAGQGLVGPPDGNHHRTDAEQHQVDQREDILAEDAGQRAAAGKLKVVALAARAPGAHPRLVEAGDPLRLVQLLNRRDHRAMRCR